MSLKPFMLAAVPAAAILSASPLGADDSYDDPLYDGRRDLTRHAGLYASGFLGGALGSELDLDGFDLDLESGLLFGGSLGVDNIMASRGGDFRLEAEVSHRSHDPEIGGPEVDLTTLLGNLWYDFHTGGALVPYAGGGVGVGFLDEVDTDTGFAFQLGGGANYHLSDKMFMGMNYRYLFSDFELEDAFGPYDVNYGGHQISVNLGFKF